MKYKNLYYFLLLLVLLPACHTAKIYTSPNFNKTKSSIKQLAILPFDVTVNKNRMPNGMKADFMKKARRMGGFNMQKNAFSWLAKRRKNYTVEIQDVNLTNELLQKNNITIEQLQIIGKSELCRLLNVDGIISGRAELTKLMSDMGAETVYDLTGFVGTNNKAATSLAIHNTSNELLWQFEYRTSGTSGSTTASMINELMVKAAKRFPYKTAAQ